MNVRVQAAGTVTREWHKGQQKEGKPSTWNSNNRLLQLTVFFSGQ
jgi:hypothetical protein